MYIGTALEALFVIYRLLFFDPLRHLLIFVSSVRYSDELVMINFFVFFFFEIIEIKKGEKGVYFFFIFFF